MNRTSTMLQADYVAQTVAGQDRVAPNARLEQIFDLREHRTENRNEIENFIRQRFAVAHDAKIENFMPRLLSLCTKQGNLIAAFGLRAAQHSPLFLEAYLDQPIEHVLQSKLGEVVEREEIIEVGNLSALYPCAARWLILALTAKLYAEGYKWVSFTGISALRNSFTRLGLRPITLGVASLEHLPVSDRANWGSYYDNAPMVMVGNIGYGYRSLMQERSFPELLRAGMSIIEAA